MSLIYIRNLILEIVERKKELRTLSALTLVTLTVEKVERKLLLCFSEVEAR